VLNYGTAAGAVKEIARFTKANKPAIPPIDPVDAACAVCTVCSAATVVRHILPPPMYGEMNGLLNDERSLPWIT
jgi:hypothetical protein